MAHKYYWIDEPWLMAVEYSETITAAEVDEMMGICVAAAEKHPINFLVDVSGANRFEPALLRTTSTLKLLQHPGTRWFAFVGMSGVIRAVVQLLNRFAHFSRFKGFGTREEAIAFLQEMLREQKAERV